MSATKWRQDIGGGVLQYYLNILLSYPLDQLICCSKDCCWLIKYVRYNMINYDLISSQFPILIRERPFDFYDGGGGQGSRFWIYLRLILLFLYYSIPCIFINSRRNYFYLCICYFLHHSCILTFLFKIRLGPGILF